VVFDRVSFRYAGGGDAVALRDVSFAVRRGETVALVGRSGAGKSTIFNIVSRFLEPTSGEVRIDGRPLRGYELSSLRRGIGLVGQDIVLFHDTVRNNVSFADPGRFGEAEVRAAAETAHASGFIERLPRGYDTVLSEGGQSLSRGERQRIAIARAVLCDPSLLLLDEITSSLHAES